MFSLRMIKKTKLDLNQMIPNNFKFFYISLVKLIVVIAYH